MHKKISMGIVGAGRVANERHLPILLDRNDVQLDWVYDHSFARASSLSQKAPEAKIANSLEDLAGVDCVLLTIPVGVRKEFWGRAQEFGWAVFCEKPVATDLQEFERILDIQKHNCRPVSHGLNRRYYAGTRQLTVLGNSGILDDVSQIIISDCQIWSNTGLDENTYVAQKSSAGGGVLIETGTHTIDQLAFSLGLCKHSHVNITSCTASDGLETSISGCSKLQWQERDVPLRFRFSVSDSLMNGIFLKKPGGYIHLGTTPDAMPVWRDENFTKVCEFSMETVGVQTVNAAAAGMWDEFLKQVGSGMTEVSGGLETCRFTVEFIDSCYKQIGATGGRLNA